MTVFLMVLSAWVCAPARAFTPDRTAANNVLLALEHASPDNVAALMLSGASYMEGPVALLVPPACARALHPLRLTPWEPARVRTALGACEGLVTEEPRIPDGWRAAAEVVPAPERLLLARVLRHLVHAAGRDEPERWRQLLPRVLAGAMVRNQRGATWPERSSVRGDLDVHEEFAATTRQADACLQAESAFPGVDPEQLGRRAEVLVVLTPAGTPSEILRVRQDAPTIGACLVEAAGAVSFPAADETAGVLITWVRRAP